MHEDVNMLIRANFMHSRKSDREVENAEKFFSPKMTAFNSWFLDEETKIYQRVHL